MQFDAYTSDLHFGHRNILKYCNRPYPDVEAMHEGLIVSYNQVVGPKDRVLFLGDVFLCNSLLAEEVMKRLNGEKYLLRGNHDKDISDSRFAEIGFKEVFPSFFKAQLGAYPVWYSHYPFEGYSKDMRYPSRRPPKDETVIVHGHTHEKTRLTEQNTVHIGVDGWNYYPARVEDVEPLVAEAYKRKAG